MADEQLDIKIKTVLAQATNEFNRLTSAASNFDKTLVNVVQRVDLLNKTVTTTATSADGMKKVIQTVDENGNKLKETFVDLSKQGKKTKSSLSSVFDLNRLYLYWNLTKRLRDRLKQVFTLAVDYNETVNKFNVSMRDSRYDATKFVNDISEAVGIGKAELMEYQATYKNILSGLGSFSDQQSEKISESLVKMALDYSSLFNVDRSSAMNKFQAALTGSIRPIRSDSGFDVSEQTIGEKAKELGLDRTIGQLNQTEKRMLRIIILMEQMKNTGAFNDLARTIEEPANQVKVLQDQIQELGVWIGNVFMGTIGSVLPYINAFVMVLKEIVRTLAIFVGYESTSSGFQDAFEVAEDAAEGIAGGVGSANKSAKELRKTLMGFDVLNVITTPKESDSSGGDGVGYIDPKILDALDEYDSLMENVRMKATDIRDKIMDWLGFIKIIDPITGEISWKLRDGYQNIEKILDITKAVGFAFLSWKVSTGILKIFDALSGKKTNNSILKTGITLAITGFYLAYKGSRHMIEGDISLGSLLETLLGSSAGAFGLSNIIKAFSKGKVGLAKSLPITIGLALTFTVVSFSYAAIKKNYDLMVEHLHGDVEKESLAVSDRVMTGIVTIFYTIGEVFSEAWLSVKNFFGLLSDEEQRMYENNKKVSDSIQVITETYKEQSKAIVQSANDRLIEIEYANRLYLELQKVTDENGLIQEGYEKRAEFIVNELNSALGTEYSVNGNIIEQYGTMRDTIQEIIDKKKTEIQVEAYSDLYKESLKNKIKLQQEYNGVMNNLKEAQEQYNLSLQQNAFPSQTATENLNNAKEAALGFKDKLIEADKEVDYYAKNLNEKMQQVNGDVTISQETMATYEYEMSEDVRNMSQAIDNYQTDYANLKNNIVLDTDDMILSYDEAQTEMENMEEKTDTTTSNMKKSFDGLSTISTALDGPLATLLSNINPTFGMGLNLVNAMAKLASALTSAFQSNLNLNGNFSIGGGRW